MKSEKQLLEQRANIVNQVRDKWADVRKEGRDPNADEVAFFEKADVDITAITAEIDDVRKVGNLADKAGKYADLLVDTPRSVTHGGSQSKIEHRDVLKKWMMNGELSPEERSVLGSEQRGTSTQISSTTTLGGYAMPEDWANDLEKTMLWYGGALEACGISLRSSGGGDFHYPTLNDTSNKAVIIGQGSGDTVKDLTLGEKIWKAWSYTTGLIKWSIESFDDLNFNIEAETRAIFAERMGRGLNYDFTLGTDTTMPLGLVTGASSGKTAASASAITRNELVDLIHSVDPAYRKGPKVAFMFNDSTLSYIKKLAFGDSDDRPLWQNSIREGEPDRIEGFKYFINQDMASIATGNKTILFGDFDKYKIRQIGNYIFAKSAERYFEERAVAYSLFARFDGRYLNTSAVKYLVQA
jgi:HK97 family phage major capsid protein